MRDYYVVTFVICGRTVRSFPMLLSDAETLDKDLREIGIFYPQIIWDSSK